MFVLAKRACRLKAYVHVKRGGSVRNYEIGAYVFVDDPMKHWRVFK